MVFVAIPECWFPEIKSQAVGTGTRYSVVGKLLDFSFRSGGLVCKSLCVTLHRGLPGLKNPVFTPGRLSGAYRKHAVALQGVSGIIIRIPKDRALEGRTISMSFLRENRTKCKVKNLVFCNHYPYICNVLYSLKYPQQVYKLFLKVRVTQTPGLFDFLAVVWWKHGYVLSHAP